MLFLLLLNTGPLPDYNQSQQHLIQENIGDANKFQPAQPVFTGNFHQFGCHQSQYPISMNNPQCINPQFLIPQYQMGYVGPQFQQLQPMAIPVAMLSNNKVNQHVAVFVY